MRMFNGEAGYLKLLQHILDSGVQVPDRTGVGCRAVFDVTLRYVPGESTLSTVRSTPLRMSFEEFWMMLKGETQTKQLEEKNIFFWQPQTSREFLDNRGLYSLPEGDMGKAYGWQWRNFGGTEAVTGADQLKYLLDTLKNDRYSRRNLITLWNPLQNDEKALTECWYASQWVVLPQKSGRDMLHCKLSNRSLDALFGCQFAIQQYRLLQYALCEMFDFDLGEISATSTHCHLYSDQLEYTKELLTRTPTYKSGEIKIKKDLNNLEDLLSLQWEDIEVVGHEVNKIPFKTPKPKMAA